MFKLVDLCDRLSVKKSVDESDAAALVDAVGVEIETEGDVESAVNSLITVSSDERELDSDTDMVGDDRDMLGEGSVSVNESVRGDSVSVLSDRVGDMLGEGSV